MRPAVSKADEDRKRRTNDSQNSKRGSDFLYGILFRCAEAKAVEWLLYDIRNVTIKTRFSTIL